MKTILILGTLDTKGNQIQFLKKLIENAGHSVILMDNSTREAPALKADITCDEIALAAGVSIGELRHSKERVWITSVMTEGSIKKAQELFVEERFDAIVSLGGATAATVATAVMKALPFGIPKLMVCSAAGMPYAGKWFGTGDIQMMNTIVDLAGDNQLVKNVLTRAAGAVCGMVAVTSGGSLADLLSGRGKPLVAMTEDGASERCGTYVRQGLEKRGYEAVSFSVNGFSDRAMEELIGQGFFDGVVDIALMGVSDELFEGNRPGGPNRLEMAGRRGIPMVIAPCGLNQTGCGPTRKNAAKYASRPRVLKLDELRMGTRLNEEELALTARTVAEKLNRAKGPVKFFIPLKGFSGFDPPGGVLYCPDEDKIFIDEVKRLVKPRVEILEIDANLEESIFAQALLDGFVQLMETNKERI
jgi:uncharacterized protein (UPF0261 family)